MFDGGFRGSSAGCSCFVLSFLLDLREHSRSTVDLLYLDLLSSSDASSQAYFHDLSGNISQLPIVSFKLGVLNTEFSTPNLIDV